MRRHFRRAVAAVLLLFVALAAQAAPLVRHVVIISLDGGKPAVIRTTPTPTLQRIPRDGAGTWEARTIVPSITLPSHTSMLTGVRPETHGVLWNDYLPEKGIVRVPTVFSMAHAAGYSTAMFAGKEKFKHLDIPGSIDHLVLSGKKSSDLAREAADYIRSERPALCFVHFGASDSTGHKYGWGSPEQRKAFEDEDRGVAILIESVKRIGIADSAVVIVTADHGGHEKTHGDTSADDMTIPWLVWGTGVRRGFAVPGPVVTVDTTATALWLLGVDRPATLEGKPVTAPFRFGAR